MTNFRIFDTHQHIGSLDATKAMSHDDDYALRSANLDKFGMTAAIAMPSLAYPRPRGIADTQAINNAVADYRNRFAARFPVALGTVQPTDPEAMAVGELERMANELELDGVVWHHRFQGTWLSDARMHPLLDACAKLKLVVYVHVIADSNLESPCMLEELYEAHPDVTFVALDPFTSFSQIRIIMQMAKRCPNLMFDTAICMPLGRSVEEFVRKFGSQRLMFGSDMYLTPPSYVYPYVLTEILEAPTLTDDDRRNILWDNAERLFPRAFARLGQAAR